MTVKTCIFAMLTTVTLAALASAAEVRGVISKVDLDRNEITLEGRGKAARGMTYSFAVDKDARILLGGEPATLKDLAPGKHVHVFFETHGDRTVALMIKGFALGAPATTSTPPSPTDPKVTGTLQRVAYTEHEIVVVGNDAKGADTETTFRVPTDIKVRRDGRPIAFDDLKEGERVAVTAEKRDGKLTATAIQVGDAPPAAAAAAKKGARLQRLLEIASQVMQMVEKMRQDRP
jgi:Cu/Ag efflux protein CusF